MAGMSPEPEDALQALGFNLRVLTITEDDEGIVAINHHGMNEARALWLLESAKYMILSGYWDHHDDDDDDDDEEPV